LTAPSTSAVVQSVGVAAEAAAADPTQASAPTETSTAAGSAILTPPSVTPPRPVSKDDAVSDRLPEEMTAAQRDALAAELAELEGPRRAAVVDAIATARAFGDLSENFAYHDAKNEQGLLERRITILQARLNGAVIVEGADDGVVRVGSIVEVEDDTGERLEVEISSVGGVSPDSPLGAALVGARVGDVVEVTAPRGAWHARVLSVRRGG